jgi:hypothetical protein
MLLVILEEIESERKLLHRQQVEFLAGSQFQKFLDLMNSAEYYLQGLEERVQSSL